VICPKRLVWPLPTARLVTRRARRPGEEAGMEPGDVILTFDGTEVIRHAANWSHRWQTPKWAKPSVWWCSAEGQTRPCASTLARRETRERAVPPSAPADVRRLFVGDDGPDTVGTDARVARRAQPWSRGHGPWSSHKVDGDSEAVREGLARLRCSLPRPVNVPSRQRPIWPSVRGGRASRFASRSCC